MLIHQKRISRSIRNTKVLRYILNATTLSYLIQYPYPIRHHSSISRQTILTILIQQMTYNLIQYITPRYSRSPTTYSLINRFLHILTQALTLITHLHHITTSRSEEHTSELQSRFDLVCRLLL